VASCSQCGKPAIYEFHSHILCLDCTHKVTQIQQQDFENNAVMLNFAADQIDSIVGFPGNSPRMEIPKRIVIKNPQTFNHIKVSNSVVGSINTGNIKSIEIAMSDIKNRGDEEVYQVLKEFTEAIITESNISHENKNEILERIDYLATQVVVPEEQRSKGIIRDVMFKIKESVSDIDSLQSLWNKLQRLVVEAINLI